MNISVYIPSYNQKDYLSEAIKSVLNQTLPPYEILVIDDCSTDGSQDLIRSFSSTNPIVKYLFNERNEGVSNVRRKALSNVKGDYVTYLDGDDLYLPNKLRLEAKLMDSGGYDLTFSNNLYVDPDNPDDVRWVWAFNKNEFPVPGNMYIETLARDFPRGSLFRMELVNVNLIRSVGTYDENLKIYEDYDFRIRLSEKARINFSLEPTTKIRISKQGLSKSQPEIHYENLKYIFLKHANAIESFPEPLRSRTKLRIERFLDEVKSRGKSDLNIRGNFMDRMIQFFKGR